MAKMRILVVDDHEVVRRGVRSLLSASAGVEVCGEAVDGRDAIEKAQQLKPDVVAMDITMPRMNGLDATREIRRILPDIHVLILSQHDVPEMTRQALKAGASGFVVKSAISTELIAALQKIQNGKTFFNGKLGAVQRSVNIEEILHRSAAFETALRESEELFRLTFEQVAVGMAHVAEDGRWLRVNRKFCQILGYTEDELKQKTFQEITHPADLARDLELKARLARAEMSEFTIEERYLRKDGISVWVNLTVAAVRDSAGKVKYFLSVVEDISARKKTEEGLTEAEAYFRAIVEATPDCVKLVAQDGTLHHMNSSGLRMLEADSAEDVVGKSVFDLIADKDRERFRQFHETVCAGNKGTSRFDVVGMRGTVRHMETHAVPLRASDGSMVELSVTRDITERAQQEIAQGRLAAIVESSEDAIISKDLDGVITSWNSAAENIFGYSAEEAVGQSIRLIIPPELQDEEDSILARLRRGERIAHYDTVRQRKDGARRHVSLTISPVRDASGRIVGASKIARDVTGRKLAEQAEREAELSGRLLQLQDEERRHIARELHDGAGQSLAALSMNLGAILRERECLGDRVARLADESVKLVQQVSAEIRTLSHLLHPPLLDEVGLKSALSEYVGGFAERSKIDVKLELPQKYERLPRDYELSLFRIVQESLTNIHRHSGSATALVRLTYRPGQISLEIIDQGKGIDRVTQEKFMAGRSSGVGLRGMRERIRQIGGTLDIISNEHGTSVLAVLPLREEMESGGGDRSIPRFESAD